VQRLVIPFNALRRDQKGEYVFAIDDQQKVERVSVVSGLRIDEQVEILTGLSEGQQIVTKGFLDLTVGKKVKVVSHEKTQDKFMRPKNIPKESVNNPEKT
jgi:membrane fusion protein (multidrug efflux system)